eukprot:NODE_39238_length_170_cov_2.685950_g38068_i0.p3 GENE.NODE_39238_length_170_cov_2.685950_g38068_i0~~NODE_39238_length_170_cov_2.685950_g38068_i0.p3  ORF type:complete len:50 (-),score=3.56 NODE_39238_length_170_cov_2.685950_g38068_i0:21-143(-)
MHEKTEGSAVGNGCWYLAASLAVFCRRSGRLPAAGFGAKR